MTELIKITEENGRQVVSARDLHEFLVRDAKGGQIGEDFSNWIKRQLVYLDAVPEVNYVVVEYDYKGNPVSQPSETDTQKVIVHKREYALTLDLAKEISMIQNNDRGKMARAYFIERDKKLAKVEKVGLQMPNFNNPAEAARAWADEYEQRQLAQSKVKELEPPAQYAKEVLDTENAFPITHIAKELGMSARKLNERLRDMGVQHKVGGVWVLKGKHQSKGYTKMVTNVLETKTGGQMSSHHTYWTEKGRQFVHSLFNGPPMKFKEEF